MPKCPKCQTNLDVHLIAAPPMQSEQPGQNAMPDNLKDLLTMIDDEQLKDGGEQKFVAETRARFDQYGDRTRMSDRQMNWLKRIAENMDVPF